MGSTKPGENADDRVTQEVFDDEASVHVDMSASTIVADGVSTSRGVQVTRAPSQLW
jgi:hypothetical protein